MQPPSFLDMLRPLIATPSVSSVNARWDQGNRAVIDLLAGWLENLGFRIEIQPLPGAPEKANLIATHGQGEGGLVLAGHTDTVPYDEGRWSQDPFHLTERNGRLYGLGTADMKSFFPMVIEALRTLPKGSFTNPLTILATADEESSMAGARALVEAGRPLGRHAVIGEPTGLRPIRMHKGIMMEAIRLRGRSGHSSDPSLGNSALEGMHRAMGEILAWRTELQAQHHSPVFAVPVPTLNLGHIHGGDNPNRICGECELQIDLRPLPGMELQELRAALHERLETALADSGLTLEVAPLFDGIPAMETPAGAEIVRAAEKLTGTTAGSTAFGTEGPYLRRLGLDVVILGPGDIAQAHQPDEFLETRHIQPGIELLQSLVKTFCT